MSLHLRRNPFGGSPFLARPLCTTSPLISAASPTVCLQHSSSISFMCVLRHSPGSCPHRQRLPSHRRRPLPCALRHTPGIDTLAPAPLIGGGVTILDASTSASTLRITSESPSTASSLVCAPALSGHRLYMCLPALSGHRLYMCLPGTLRHHPRRRHLQIFFYGGVKCFSPWLHGSSWTWLPSSSLGGSVRG